VAEPRLFYVAPRDSLSLSDLTFNNSVAQGNTRGGIAGGGAGLGGAIFNDGGTAPGVVVPPGGRGEWKAGRQTR
jgi:hypothetical protein